MNAQREARSLTAACAAATVGMAGAACVVAAAPGVKASGAAAVAAADAGAPFGKLPLVEEIDCAAAPPSDKNLYAEAPAGGSRVETLAGRACRVLPNEGDAKYFAYKVGRGKGLKPGQAYMLEVEYPDDRPRSIFIRNHGAETTRGFATGSALGDVLFTYTNNNVESLKLQQTGKMQRWRSLFFLHDRFPPLAIPRNSDPRAETPDGGFWVVVCQSRAENDPASAGAAVSRIRLWAVPDPDALAVKHNPPPAGLPRRHLFWREEMSDSVVGAREPAQRGVSEDAVWYDNKARLARFLGINTLCKDLLEFGHNQGWDAGPNDDWYVNPPQKDRWEKIVGVAAKRGLSLLPYYEYAGSVGQKEGIGPRKTVRPLTRELPYTHITWSERFYADVTEPDTLADARRLLDATITRYKDRGAPFVGAWFRPRPSHLPITFDDDALARFVKEANGGTAVTRDGLKADSALLRRYYDWWFGERRTFFDGLAAHLRREVNPDAVVLFTADTSEPGRSLPSPMRVVTDDPAGWASLLGAPKQGKPVVKPVALDEVVRAGMHLSALTSTPGTWGEWEWQHSAPEADPQRWKEQKGALQTFTLNRAYTAASPAAFDAFRGPDGLAVAYHHPLNENVMHPDLGYFVSDVERAGPYSMLAEARAVANGDPRFVGYLTSNSYSRGFPEYARAFNAAFLSLPALPSRVAANASSDPEVVVRSIPAGAHGTYYAVVNTGLAAKRGVKVLLYNGNGAGVTDAPTGANLMAPGGALTLDLGPCELRAIRVSAPAAPAARQTRRP